MKGWFRNCYSAGMISFLESLVDNVIADYNYIKQGLGYKIVGLLPIRIVKSNVSSVGTLRLRLLGRHLAIVYLNVRLSKLHTFY